MTNLDKQRDEAWAKHDKEKMPPIPIDEIAKLEFETGFSACEKILSERIEKLEAALKETRGLVGQIRSGLTTDIGSVESLTKKLAHQIIVEIDSALGSGEDE